MNYQRVNYPNGYKKVCQPNVKPNPYQPISVPPKHMSKQVQPAPITIPAQPMSKQVQQTPTLQNNQTNHPLNVFPVDEGYLKGTIFRGLYMPYKSYSPIKPHLDDERQTTLYDVNMYNFAMIELQFYLDNFPNDQEALRLFNQYQNEYLKRKNSYEERFGALSNESTQLERSPWNWIQTPSPWEGGL